MIDVRYASRRVGRRAEWGAQGRMLAIRPFYIDGPTVKEIE